jgi:glyoxylase-like metal-dependent hydrolase (beta-lactamase superfamily II)
VDTLFDLPRTRVLLDAVAGLSRGPISTLVNTHHNGDHVFGNQLVEGATIVGHRRCLEELEKAATPEFLKQVLQAEGDEGAIGYLKRAFAPFDFSGITITPPTVTFDDTYSVDLDGKRIDLYYFGPGHTLGDIVAFVPDDGVLYAGDLLFLGSTPLLWEGSLSNWISAVDRMLELGPRTVVPGHGPVTGPEGLVEMQGYLRLVVEDGARLRAEGLSAMEAALRIDVGPYRDWVDSERIALNMLRLYLELDGNPPETPIDAFEAFGAMAEVADARSRR